VQLVKRIVGAGMGMMAAVGLVAAIWPPLADLVTGLLVTIVCTGLAVLAVLGGRWARAELAWRRQLRTMPPIDTAPYAVPPPGLAQLQESA
jgi:hypothetical protein